MSAIADDFSVGFFAAQHHDTGWKFDTLNLFKRVRILGQDPVTKQWQLGDGRNGTPETYGFMGGEFVFAPAHDEDPDSNTRNVALWGSAWPGFAAHPNASAAPTDLAPSPADPNINSPFQVYPSHSQADDGGWRDDTGLLPQPAVSFDGQDVPGGTPGVIVPLTGATTQQLAFVPSGNFLTCDWHGGPKRAKLSSRVWDVTAKGERDKERHAPVHSFWRIYKRPTSSVISFGDAPSLTSTLSQSPSGSRAGQVIAGPSFGQPEDHEDSLAWVLTPGVDGNAGRGVVSDVGAPAPPPPNRTATGQGNGPSGSVPGQGAGNAQAANAAAAPFLVGKQLVQPLTPATTLGGLQAQLAQNAALISFAASMGTAGTGALAQLQDQRNQIIQAMSLLWGHGGNQSQTGSGVVKTCLASLSKAAFGIIEVGDAGGDPHEIATTPDNEAINSAHLNILAPWKGDGHDAPVGTDGTWIKPTGGGPLITQVFFRTDGADKHPWIQGTKPGLRKWETNVPMDSPSTDEPHNPGIPDEPVPPNTPGAFRPEGVSVGERARAEANASGDAATVPVAGATDGGPAPLREISSSLSSLDTSTSDAGGPSGRRRGLLLGGGPAAGGGGPPPPKPPTPPPLPPPGNPRPPRILDEPTTTPGAVYVGPSGSPRPPISPPWSRSLLARRFQRMPNELAIPGLLARPQQLNATGAPDLRGVTDVYLGNVPQGFETFRGAPIAGVVAAFADQNGGGIRGFRLNEPLQASRYVGGVAAEGGFALHPANVDLEDVIFGKTMPAMPTTHFMAATTASRIGWADPDRRGRATNGFSSRREFTAGTAKKWILDSVDANAISEGHALEANSILGTLSTYGNRVVDVGGSGAGQVPVADGAGSYAWSGAGAYSYATTADSGSVANFEAVIAGGSSATQFPANALHVGSTFRFVLNCDSTSTNVDTSTFTLRFGAAGTTADASIGTFAFNSAGSGSAIKFRVEIELVVTAVGATGAVKARFSLLNNGTTGVSPNKTEMGAFTVTATLDTTAAGYLSLSYKTTAPTTNSVFRSPCVLEAVKI